MHIWFTIILIIFSFVVWDWHARMAFIANKYCRCYGHGKTWNRAYKHYKTHWTLLERLLWLPVFKEKYDGDTRLLVYLSYIHLVFAIIATVFFLVGELVYKNMLVWKYVVIGYFIYTLIRYFYNSAFGRQDLDKI